MRPLTAVLAALILAVAPAAHAQEADVEAREALAERLIAVTVRDTMDKLLDSVVEQMVADQVDATEEQQAWTRANVPDLIERNLGVMIDHTETLYAEHFTTEELQALVEFYDSPIGRVIALKQNEVSTLQGQDMITYLQGFVTDYRAKYCAAFDCPTATTQFNRGKD